MNCERTIVAAIAVRVDARPPNHETALAMEGERPREPFLLPQRKRPVHMPPIERHNEPIILFVTLAIQPRAPHLTNAPFHDAFVAACADADAWSVGFYLIMPDHVHLFCRPAREPRIGIKPWTTYLKRRIAIRLNGYAAREDARPPNHETALAMEGERPREPLPQKWKWQPDCWDIQLRNQDHYRERWEYVRQNPVRKSLTRTTDDWPWQGVLNVLEW